MNITRLIQFFPKYNHPVSGEKGAVNLEKKDVSPVPDQTRSESPVRRCFQGFWSRVPLRVQYVPSKPSLTMEEFRQKVQAYRDEYYRDLAQKRAEGIDQAPHQLPDINHLFDNLAKTYHYRRPWLPQVRDRRKHPILAKFFWFFWRLSYSFDPPWNHIRIIIAHKTAEKEGGAA